VRTLAKLQLPLLLVSIVAVFGACKPKAGETCESDSCADEHTLLICKHNRYLAAQCDGPKGCKVDGKIAHCDFSTNKVGSPCDDRFFGKRMCGADGKSAVTCQDGKFNVVGCSGPNGCSATGDADALVKDCDTTVAKEGDACDRNFVKQPACSADGTELLECGKDNHFGFFQRCRGPNGCKPKDGKPDCDHSVEVVGDPCTPPTPEVCSQDGVAMLLCGGDNLEFERPCPGVHSCVTAPDGHPICDSLAPIDGGPCDKKDLLRCQKPVADDKNDHGKLLVCNGTKFTVQKRCAAQCVFTRPSTYECK
jgi:hypothetical protein